VTEENTIIPRFIHLQIVERLTHQLNFFKNHQEELETENRLLRNNNDYLNMTVFELKEFIRSIPSGKKWLEERDK